MERTPDSVAREIEAIRHALAVVSAAVDRYAEIATQNVGQTSPTDSCEVGASHTALFMETHKLLRVARGPVDMVYSHFENVRVFLIFLLRLCGCLKRDDDEMRSSYFVEQSAHAGAVRAVMEMGVFEAMPRDGSSITAAVLAQKLDVEKDLLGEQLFKHN
jgi:hypothetical protein